MMNLTKEQIEILLKGVREEEAFAAKNPKKGIMNSGMPLETKEHLYNFGKDNFEKELYYRVLTEWDLPFWVRYFQCGTEAAKSWQRQKVKSLHSSLPTEEDYDRVFTQLIKEAE